MQLNVISYLMVVLLFIFSIFVLYCYSITKEFAVRVGFMTILIANMLGMAGWYVVILIMRSL